MHPTSPSFWSDVVCLPGGDIFATIEKPASVVRVNPSSGAMSEVTVSDPPNSLEVDAKGNVVIAAQQSFFSYDPTTETLTELITGNVFSRDFEILDDVAIFLVQPRSDTCCAQ